MTLRVSPHFLSNSVENNPPRSLVLIQEQKNTNAIIKGTITDNVKIAEAFIDNQELQVDINGQFEIDLYKLGHGEILD